MVLSKTVYPKNLRPVLQEVEGELGLERELTVGYLRLRGYNPIVGNGIPARCT